VIKNRFEHPICSPRITSSVNRQPTQPAADCHPLTNDPFLPTRIFFHWLEIRDSDSTVYAIFTNHGEVPSSVENRQTAISALPTVSSPPLPGKILRSDRHETATALHFSWRKPPERLSGVSLPRHTGIFCWKPGKIEGT
jgi:hypothetical protein